jgi:uncharacterized protein (TIGR02453 family)
MTTSTHITPELFTFFRQLKKNNRREWFAKHKKRYEFHVRDPLLQLVSDLGPAMAKINPHFLADPRPSGGSLFRIYRDVRFSKDKAPFKTSAGLRFPHEDRRNVHAPGFYLHLEPGSVFAGGGIWHPESKTLRQVRDRIVDDPKGWKRALGGKAFRSRCSLGGDILTRPPRGYDADHPLIEDLKRKDFIAYVPFSEEQAVSAGFTRLVVEAFRTMKPFMAFLTRAVGAPW